MAIEIERKFLVTDGSWRTLVIGEVQIRQGYFARTSLMRARIRVLGDAAFITLKSQPGFLVRHEYEYEIPVADAKEMIGRFSIEPLIVKTRYDVMHINPRNAFMPYFVGVARALLTDAVGGFFNDDGMSHSAAIAFYAVTSLAPILLIVVAIAGLGFGKDAAQVALSAQISGLMGAQSADLLKSALQSASQKPTGTFATLIGLGTLFVTASGVFGEMQLSLNKIWKVTPESVSLSRLLRARAASLGLVAALGFLLLISLIASAAIAALANLINAHLPLGSIILGLVNALVSFSLITLLFAAIYKVLPDRALEWRDVIFGAIVTAALFTVGKSLIGWYLGSSAVASSYGAAGGLLIALLWVFYSSVIFLVGAEITRSYSVRYGSRTQKGVRPTTRQV